ncbi:MAG: hypothetical protein V9F03_10515 [Microthrixaceae bacterium]
MTRSSTSVADTAGTITTTTDRLGRVVAYSDVWGKTSTATYNQGGELVAASTPAGNYAYTYTAGSRGRHCHTQQQDHF